MLAENGLPVELVDMLLRIYLNSQGVPSLGREFRRTAVRVKRYSKCHANVYIQGLCKYFQTSVLDVTVLTHQPTTCLSGNADINSAKNCMYPMEPTHYSPQHKFGSLPPLLIKFNWNTATSSHLHIACGCFSTTANLSSCNRDSKRSPLPCPDLYGHSAPSFLYMWIEYKTVTILFSGLSEIRGCRWASQ